ncbi:hypothetical protein ACFL3Q_06590 [Planctomycetota bacterium]
MKRIPVIYPFLFAMLPILNVFQTNLNLFSAREIVVPMILTSCLTLILWLLLSLLIGNRQKAGLIVGVAQLLFISFGPFTIIIYNDIGGRDLSSVLLPIWIILFAFCAYISLRTHRSLQNLTRIMNAMAVFLIMIPGIFIGIHYLKAITVLSVGRNTENIELSLEDSEKPVNLPNIYYIILDGYARDDILEELYQHDNSKFLDYFRQKGFHVAGKSRSNYAQTHLSLASSLNLQYLDGLAQEVGVEYSNRLPLTKMIKDSKVVRLLNRYGYRIVAFSSGVSFTEITNADIYIKTGHLGKFANALISNTLSTSRGKGLKVQYDTHRKSILRTFEELEKTTKLKAPIFVFAHILAPHPPFVFGEHVEKRAENKPFRFVDASHFTKLRETNRNKYQQHYKSQLIFISEKIKATIDSILSKSTIPPIIILQSDHGPGSMLDWEDPDNSYIKERMAILSAYYLPDSSDILLYDDITPVNTFRIIFNHYFGTDFELLKDKCYFSTWSHPYKFIDVTVETIENR